MRKKILGIIAIAFIITCSVVLGGFRSQESPYFQGEIRQIPFEGDGVGLSAFVDNSIIYETADELGQHAYYRKNIDTSEITKIGAIPNYVVGDRGTTILNNKYYFYATVSRGEEFEELVDVLYAIDLKTNTLAVVDEDSTYGHLIPVDNMNGKLIALKSDLHEDSGYSKTYLYEYNPLTKQGRDVLANRITLPNLKGDAFVAFTCQDDKLYAVIDSGAQKKDMSLEVYDNNYVLQKTYPIIGLESLFLEMVMEIKVKGDYVYFLSMSGSSAIGKMSEGKIDILLSTGIGETVQPINDPLDIQQDAWLFFKRRSNEFFVLNLKTGELKKEKRIFKKEYFTYYIMAGDKGNLIISRESSETPVDVVRPTYLYHYIGK